MPPLRGAGEHSLVGARRVVDDAPAQRAILRRASRSPHCPASRVAGFSGELSFSIAYLFLSSFGFGRFGLHSLCGVCGVDTYLLTYLLTYDESVSRGGTPAPLSDGSGATPRGGAAGAARRARPGRARGRERDERRCDGRRRGRRRQDGEATERGQDGVRPPLACGEEPVGMSGGCGPVCMPVCCRAPSPTPPPYRLRRGLSTSWATTWASILDHCADMNGAPLVRTPPRRSWGRGPPPQGVAANSGPSVDVSEQNRGCGARS